MRAGSIHESETVELASIRPSSICLSHHSTAAAACGGFAADRRYRSTAASAGTQQQTRSNGAAARRPAANAGSVMSTAELTRLHTDLLKQEV